MRKKIGKRGGQGGGGGSYNQITPAPYPIKKLTVPLYFAVVEKHGRVFLHNGQDAGLRILGSTPAWTTSWICNRAMPSFISSMTLVEPQLGF